MSGGYNLGNPNPTFPTSFDAAVIEGGYVSGDGCWNAYVNADAIAVWGADDVLDRAMIVERYSSRMRARFQKYRGTAAEPRTWADAGNVVHHALRLGLIREVTTTAGERGWRILERDLRWIVVGTGYHREARQVRGLPPAEQAAVDKAEASLARRRATLDRKARENADAWIARVIRDTLRSDPATVVPQMWADRGWVPSWLSGTRLDASAGIVREAHHAAAMDRRTLKAWISDLQEESISSIARPFKRSQEFAALPEHAELPDEDDAALEALL
ncbi:hypothetical protein [Methylobacterium pseudosasicola]|uniref:Uncharacterized protein n=1 Tax=Methylobacterium pseudosasicola TaxID=582667 RepID=A0A1I4U7B6_9HYPH|nr:hypothetical protein [Methylobacterium pseudosasicola]SFM84785.1 hypothetical protein SAMN05192568_106410 [Methylobacterium pseudosasicola]